MKLVFDARALADLEGIFDWIAQDEVDPANDRIIVTAVFHAARDREREG
jgi:plasmid stabilization system protein ParE